MNGFTVSWGEVTILLYVALLCYYFQLVIIISALMVDNCNFSFLCISKFIFWSEIWNNGLANGSIFFLGNHWRTRTTVNI